MGDRIFEGESERTSSDVRREVPRQLIWDILDFKKAVKAGEKVIGPT